VHWVVLGRVAGVSDARAVDWSDGEHLVAPASPLPPAEAVAVEGSVTRGNSGRRAGGSLQIDSHLEPARRPISVP
jgi:hypothetical protein